METVEFTPFRKIARLSREMIITEKIDGTNASVYIGEDGTFLTGSRNRWITPESDNAGFSKWAHAHKEELMGLGVGLHFGEWWGQGIQRGYGLKEKRFSLFNVSRWENPDTRPACCGCVPVICKGTFDTGVVEAALANLAKYGSLAVKGYMNPEGIVVFHTAGNVFFKKTLEHDDIPKGMVNQNGAEN